MQCATIQKSAEKLISIAALAILTSVLAFTSAARAQTETVLYSFTGQTGDGASPIGNLVSDAEGNLYGTTYSGGSYSGSVCSFSGCGTVYELSPALGGGYTESVIYTFSGGADGGSPAAGLVADAAGNLYGTTVFGGQGGSSECTIGPSTGCGVVFELSPKSGGGWTEQVLYSFLGGSDGFLSESPVAFDASGNLYGTTLLGGSHTGCCGEVFELSPNVSGGWHYTKLHSFTGGKDGGRPEAGVTVDSAGNLFTTTSIGGNTADCPTNSGCGTVVELSPTGSGTFTGRILHTFTGKADGGVPYAGLTLDKAGNLYGAAIYGGYAGGPCNKLNGVGGCGVIFEFSPAGSSYTAKVLYRFQGTNNVASPYSTLTIDGSGNLYGTGYSQINFEGYVFEVSPTQSGSWNETTLYTFTGGTDGGTPFNNGVILGSNGTLYGAAQSNGIAGGCSNFANGCGVVYEITR